MANADRRRPSIALALGGLVLSACASAAGAPPRLAGDGGWLRYETPEAAGWSSERLSDARAQFDAAGSAALMVVDDGVVVAAWGDVAAPLKAYSVRKSLLSVLYGAAVSSGAVDLDATVGDLELDDLGGLSDRERAATVAQLLSSTSGVYHPAAKEPPALQERPPRDSDVPGARWWYNNWGFNIAVTIYQRTTGRALANAFLTDIARPLAMEDLRADDIYLEYEPDKSEHPAYDFRISARDLARVGVLMAQDGVWNGRRVIPPAWVRRSTAAQWSFNDGAGYGFMWWVNPARSSMFSRSAPESMLDRLDHYAAIGSFGQAMVVVPDAGIVVVHRADRDAEGGVGDTAMFDLIESVLAAKVGKARADARLTRAALGRRRAAEAPDAPPTAPTARDIAAVVGDYVVSDRVTLTAYEWRGMLFLTGPRPGDSHLQLLRRPDGAFTSRSLSVVLRFVEEGGVMHLRLHFGEMRLEGVRARAP